MRRIVTAAVAIAVSALLLVSISAAQQQATRQKTTKSGVGVDTVVNCTTAANNYIPVFTAVMPPNITICNSAIFQAFGYIGIGTTAPMAPLDVAGAINTNSGYQTFGQTVLSTNGIADLFLGVGAGASNQTGQGNTFTGYQAGASNSAGNYNTFSGYQAGLGSTSDSNTFIGYQAGVFGSRGPNNTFLGYQAGYSNSGFLNTFSGSQAGYSNTTGYQNAFYGAGAGYYNNEGSGNTFLGYQAGELNTTGAGNTFIGAGAGYYSDTGNNNVYIANQGFLGDESNTLRIGQAQIATFIAGIYGVNVGGVPVQINSNGQLGAQTSSLRFKEQVRDMGDSTSALMKLRPVTFLYKPEYSNGDRTLQYGLIAEEVAKVYPELVAYDKDGQPYSVRYQYIATMLLNEVQKQYRRAEAQAQQIKAEQQEIESLKRQLQVQNATMQERLTRLESLVRVEMCLREIAVDGVAANP